jgi:2-desacetyl-2-hydroxyethyl bacteriochlorophyllide A dehydrogenase
VNLFSGEFARSYPVFHGHEPAGIVVEAGERVTGLAPGDKVACLGSPSYRRHYIARAREVVRLKDQSADPALWISEPATCAVHGVQATNLQLGDKVVLIGCGYMGSLVLQALPREMLSRLIVADPDGARLDIARSLGASETIDPGQSDLVDLAGEIDGFDVVIEASGARGTLSLATEMLRVGGTLNIFGHHAGEEMVPTHEWHYKALRVLNTAPMMAPDIVPYFRAAVALMETGRITQAPLITHRFPFSECQRALDVATSKADGYSKGVILF